MVRVEPEGEFQVEPLQMLDRIESMLQNRAITQVKLQWKHFTTEEATLEMEVKMRETFPALFQEEWNLTKTFRMVFMSMGGGCNIHMTFLFEHLLFLDIELLLN